MKGGLLMEKLIKKIAALFQKPEENPFADTRKDGRRVEVQTFEISAH